MENNSKIHIDERIDHGRSEKVAYTETGSNLGCQTGGEVMQRQQFPIKHFMGQCCNFKFSPAVRVRNQEENGANWDILLQGVGEEDNGRPCIPSKAD